MADEDPGDFFVRSGGVVVPSSFVDLQKMSEAVTVSREDVEQVKVNPIDFRNEIAIRISREMAIDFGIVEPTDEERAAMAAESERIRVQVAEQRAKPGPPLTLEALLGMLGWPAEFAEHVLHPACHCDVLDDDPYLCGWATELGWELSWDENDGRVVRRGGDD